MKQLILFLFVFVNCSVFGQLNIDSLSHIDYQLLHDANLNDVWGYVDEVGNEYAIVGTSKGTSIVDVTNASNPQEIFWLPGTASIWRDPSVYGDYAYITTEANDGLLIIDLSPLPFSTILPSTFYTGTPAAPWQSAHTCFLDENGFAYIFGANRSVGGAIILDVHTDPMNPVEVGVFEDWYVHDGFVRNDTMFLAHIYDGFFSLVDVADKANPVLLGTQVTPNHFTHNIWPTDNGHFAFTTDEVSGAFIASYNIEDPANMYEVDRIQHSVGQGVIPHNTHVLGDYLVTSYYSDGITIHDISNPANMVLVGEFDTYPGQTTGFDGCWGVYPFLPSGTILAADITKGLFILGPHYQKAAYLEGTITDANSFLAIQGVQVSISNSGQQDFSNANGDYATGIFGNGNYSVTYSKVGYFPQTIGLTLNQNQTVYQDMQLIPIPPFTLVVSVTEAGTGIPVSGVKLLLKNEFLAHEGVTNGLGQETMTLYYQQNYTVTAGKWAYMTTCFDQVIDNSTGVVNIEVEKGYQDEFTFDYGWTVVGTATTGIWERGKPNATNGGVAPGFDADYDCGVKAFVTGNDPSLNADFDDVDNGNTRLISPTMDLTGYADPYLNYARWFFCLHGATPNDTLEVFVSNGFTAVRVDKIGSEPSTFFQWQPKSIRLSDFISVTNSMHVYFNVADENPDVNVTEAGVDYFYISNGSTLDIPAIKNETIRIYPNPFSNEILIDGDLNAKNYSLLDLNGKVLLNGFFDQNKALINTVNVDSGLYLLKIENELFKVMKD